MIALGNAIAGMWSPDDAMAESISAAAGAGGEQVWRMPLEQAYWEQMTSPIADMKNTGMGKGGAITAALFLQQFIEKGEAAGEEAAGKAKDKPVVGPVTWAHLDIAGPVWDDKAGATGYGAATLTHWVLAQGAAAAKK
jgi:leucyl aminopeptidase